MAPRDEGSSSAPSGEWIERRVEVRQEVGTHLRVVKRIAEILSPLDAEVFLTSNSHRASARSLLDMLQLGARTGDYVRVAARGPEAARAVALASAVLHARQWNGEIDG